MLLPLNVLSSLVHRAAAAAAAAAAVAVCLGGQGQGCTFTVYGLCVRGWMMYLSLACGAIQNITEPCLQSIMATFVTVDCQGSLQVYLSILEKLHYMCAFICVILSFFLKAFDV